MNRAIRTRLVVVVVAAAGLALFGACQKRASRELAAMDGDAPAPPPPPPPAPSVEAPAKVMAMRGAAANVDGAIDTRAMDEKKEVADHEGGKKAKNEPEDGKDKHDKGESATAPMRAWFPETFLFAPRVITDDTGAASVDVLVPDRLTTWRVLALAHSRHGAQAGAVTTLVSQLPVSVDVVVPPFLMAGDRLSLPIQVVNATPEPLTRDVVTHVEGATLTGAPTSIRVDAQSSSTALAWLDASVPGDVAVQASVGKDDNVRRTITVKSPGRPRHEEKSGTLAKARSVALPLEPGVLPRTAYVSLQVFPGALAILRSEIASAPDRSSVDDEAYLLSLAGRGRALSEKLGAPIDQATLDHLARLAGQRLARYALSPDIFQAMTLAPGALASDPDSLIGRNGDHLAVQVARAQRPDGTFAGESGWPLQRLVVATADGVVAVRAGAGTPEGKSRATAASLKARGAFERFGGQIDDAYTAAVVLATGVVEGELQKDLKKKVLDAIVPSSDGMRSLPVPSGVVRADGTTPSTVEATAFAVLALHDEPSASALLPDLGATVLSAYRPGVGFGDGATNRAALDAVALLFSQPLPAKVAVALTVDGKPIGNEVLEGERLHEVLTLGGTLDKVGPALSVKVEADPPLPGLSYVVSVDYAVPWPAPIDAGLSLDVSVKGTLAVGRPVDVVLRANAPGGTALHVVQGLPAGVDPVRSSLDALVTGGVITHYDVNDGVVVIEAPGRRQGELFNATYKVVPTLAGQLHSRVASVRAASSSSEVFFPPAVWNIAR